jgi:hypothetical protein
VFAETEAAAKAFETDPAQGPRLQALLLAYDKDTPYSSYIEEFWNDAYLTPDESTVRVTRVHVPPYSVAAHCPICKRATAMRLLRWAAA